VAIQNIPGTPAAPPAAGSFAILNCSMHHLFQLGVAIVGNSKNVYVDSNVITRSVGAAVYTSSTGTRIRKNLAVNSVFPGTHNGNNLRMDTRTPGGFEILGSGAIVQDNVAGGSERSGFLVSELKCGSAGVTSSGRRFFDGNEAHGTHFNVRVERGSRDCLQLHGMKSWKASEYGLLTWTSS